MTYDTTNPEDEQIDNDPPCKHEIFTGICMICGAGPDEECGWEC